MINRVILVGNIRHMVFDEEVEQCAVTLETTTQWRDVNRQTQETSESHNVVVEDPRLVAILADYARVGQRAYVEGRLRPRYVDAGKYRTEIVAETVKFLQSRLAEKVAS